MKSTLKRVLSKRGIVIILSILLILTCLNTYLIFEGIRLDNKTNPLNYDYVLSQDNGAYRIKSTSTGYISEQESASSALNTALSLGNSIYINLGTYELKDNVIMVNKQNAKIISDGAIIKGNGHKIIVYGDNYTTSKYATISGLTIINATVRIENSFATTITNTQFINASTGIEFANTNTWSEYSKVENCQFTNNTESIVFRTPLNATMEDCATGSYASSLIERCSFKIRDFSTGIKVERLAEFSDSQVQNVRFWMGENGRENQTAMFVDGSMYQTILSGVVFECFSSNPVYVFAIDIGENCDPAPILDSGVSFLGVWTARIHNPFSIYISGVGTIFEREVSVPVGFNGEYMGNATVECKPLKIFSFKPKIEVTGQLSQGEILTVRLRIEYIDNVLSKPITRIFNESSSVWLTDDEMMNLFSSQSIVWAIIIDAKTNMGSTNASVKVTGYGSSG